LLEIVLLEFQFVAAKFVQFHKAREHLGILGCQCADILEKVQEYPAWTVAPVFQAPDVGAVAPQKACEALLRETLSNPKAAQDLSKIVPSYVSVCLYNLWWLVHCVSSPHSQKFRATRDPKVDTPFCEDVESCNVACGHLLL
jgi:hypothetical protein